MQKRSLDLPHFHVAVQKRFVTPKNPPVPRGEKYNSAKKSICFCPGVRNVSSDCSACSTASSLEASRRRSRSTDEAGNQRISTRSSRDGALRRRAQAVARTSMASRSLHTISGESRAVAVDLNPSCAAKVKSSTSSSRGLSGSALGAQAGATGPGRVAPASKGGRRRAEPSYGRRFGPRWPLHASERVRGWRMPVALTGHGERRRQPRDRTRRRPSRLPAFPGTRTEGAVW